MSGYVVVLGNFHSILGLWSVLGTVRISIRENLNLVLADNVAEFIDLLPSQFHCSICGETVMCYY